MAKAPPKFVIPPPPAKKGSSGAKGTPWQQFVNYWAAHGYKQLRANSQAILLAARAAHIDPVTFGAVILNESGGNFNVGNSSTGAIGVGQLEPGTFIGPNAWNNGVLPWNTSHQITMADLQNPAINLRLSASYYAYLQGQYPSDTYGRYNAGPNASDAQAGAIQQAFWAKWVTKWNPKYVPTTSTTSAPSAAGPQVPGGTAPPAQDIKDPWVVLTKKGQFGYVASQNPPKNVVKYAGQPITQSGFHQVWTQTYADTYQAYTGRKASAAAIVQILKTGPSVYTLGLQLSARPTFTSSPIYKQHAKGFLAVGRSILGNTWNPSGDTKGIIRRAIAGNWDQSTFEEKLRQSKEYLTSPEFKTNLAQNVAQYQSIFGNTDNATQAMLKQKTLDGWTPDQVGAWLRAQPAYKYSAEYQSKSLSFLGSLGLITGQQATLSDAQVNQLLASGDKIAAAQPNAVTNPANVTQPSPPPGTPPRIQPTPAGGIHVPGGTI